jgi:hypothetical protein
MSEQETGQWIPDGDQVVAELRSAVHAGDVEAVQRLLDTDPALAAARLGSKASGTATPLHLVTDWPGYFPNGPADRPAADRRWRRPQCPDDQPRCRDRRAG